MLCATELDVHPGPAAASSFHVRFADARGRVKRGMMEATAKEIGYVSLAEALELTILIVRKDPRRHPRVAARWLLRYLEECPETTIDEAALAASCLAALLGDRHRDAELALRAMAERATSRQQARGVG
jgi:hypothetical protein